MNLTNFKTQKQCKPNQSDLYKSILFLKIISLLYLLTEVTAHPLGTVEMSKVSSSLSIWMNFIKEALLLEQMMWSLKQRLSDFYNKLDRAVECREWKGNEIKSEVRRWSSLMKNDQEKKCVWNSRSQAINPYSDNLPYAGSHHWGTVVLRYVFLIFQTLPQFHISVISWQYVVSSKITRIFIYIYVCVYMYKPGAILNNLLLIKIEMHFV